MREEENYSYKTPSSQLVKIAEIASHYKGRPEMLMKVITKVQKIEPAFSAESRKRRKQNISAWNTDCRIKSSRQ